MELLNGYELYDHQKDIIPRGVDIIKRHRFLYLALEVRTGKTLISMGICNSINVKKVLFLTTKKAMSSIKGDYAMIASPNFELEVINYESMHKVSRKGWDLIVLDEAHGLGAMPKPSKRAKNVKELIFWNDPYVILLSGTPTPESYAQMYHQVYAIPNNPFHQYPNFYNFARDYITVVKKVIGNNRYSNCYKRGSIDILNVMKPYTISKTQKEAGFDVEIKEHVLEVEMDDQTMKLIKRLRRDRVIMGSKEVVLADTGIKLMSKIHQMCSGTVKFESGKAMTLNTKKAEFIFNHFKGKKIAIFYKFKQELKALQQVFGETLCTELDDFNGTDKHIALQIVSGREGITLREADVLVYYNIDFSATSYWQSRDRMTTKNRLKNDVYWIFSKGGIEKKIYKAVQEKRDYTLSHFKRDLLNL